MKSAKCNLHKRFVCTIFILAAFFIAIFGLWSRTSSQSSKSRILISSQNFMTPKQPFFAKIQSSGTSAAGKSQLADLSRGPSVVSVPSYPAQVFVHTFFYGWYGTPIVDRSWIHWNHPVLPHWDAAISKQFPSGTFSPEEGQIGADFHPAEAVYSSANRSKIDIQVMQMLEAGIGVAVVSWWGRREMFPTGKQCSEMRQCWDTGNTWNAESDETLDFFMDACARFGLKVSFHIEPYPGRSELTVRDDIMYIIHRFGLRESLYRLSSEDTRPVFYIYDSYQISSVSWSKIFSLQGEASIRRTSYDVVALGLWVEQTHGNDLASGCFDGFYTYFASDGFVFGSSRANWPSMVDFAKKNSMLSSISVGPGYCDGRVRPWNHLNTKERRDGLYYRESWNAAAALNPSFISITSWNEWHEGTQIEDCIDWYLTHANRPATVANAQSKWQDIASKSPYRDYGIGGPSMYRHLTLELVKDATAKRKT